MNIFCLFDSQKKTNESLTKVEKVSDFVIELSGLLL